MYIVLRRFSTGLGFDFEWHFNIRVIVGFALILNFRSLCSVEFNL